MQIVLSSIMVDDQDKALRFYTETVGFVKKTDAPMGPSRWLTVTSPKGADGVELVLEPIAFPPAKKYQKALFEAGIPATAFGTADIHAEYRRLKDRGVVFRGEPATMGPVISAMFEDTCGNLISLVQRPSTGLGRTTPIIRIFDEAKAKEFYVDYLGFKVDWEHGLEEGLPLYMQISSGDCVIHLSEHHGDSCPGGAIRIEASHLEALHAELARKDYKYARPNIEEKPWGTRDMSILDPFGNKLTFTCAVNP